MKAIADIHCHPTLHPFAHFHEGEPEKNSLWYDNPPNPRQRRIKYPEFFQSSMPALVRGNVRLVVASLYPLEQPWLKPRLFGSGELSDVIASDFMVHIPNQFIDKVQDDRFDYFNFLEMEYQFLLKDRDENHTVNGENWKYRLATNGAQVKAFLNEPNTIVVLTSIEGAHSLVSGNANDIYDHNDKGTSHLENIKYMKTMWDFQPLFVTLSHHFYNGICGHARSIPDGAGSFLLNQSVGLGEPFNKLGEEVVDCLLGINAFEGNGKRILIDTKHLSVAARLQYYDKIKQYNTGKSTQEKIPILASHSAFNGAASLQDSIAVPDMVKNKYKNSTIFNPWSINISKQEIVDIFNSGGLIGLNLDQRVLSGNQVIQKFKQMITNQEIRTKSPEIARLWGLQVATQIIEIVKAVVENDSIPTNEKPGIWDVLCIGSDFDGMINPIDSCIVSDEFKELRETLEEILPLMPGFATCKFDYSIEEIMDKIMYTNAVNFIIQHY